MPFLSVIFRFLMSENIIFFDSADFESVGCDKKQAMRYLGCRDTRLTKEIEELYNECLELIGKEIFFKAVWRKSKIEFLADSTVKFDFGSIRSEALCKNLENCKSAYVFAATAGIGVDRLLMRYKLTDTGKMTVLSSIGSSCIECWCDRINEKMADGKKTRPRFSPGYGGVDLKHQKEILEYLDAEKKIGITLTDSFFMKPVKSVTAFVGISEE